MSVMNHLAIAAAAILLLELLVVVLIFAGISGGLAFGLRWVNGKTEWAFGKANGYLPIGRRYVHLGTDYVAKPFILLGGLVERVTATAASLRRQSLALQARRAAPPPAVSPPPALQAPAYSPSATAPAAPPVAVPPVAARPVSPPEVGEPIDPLV